MPINLADDPRGKRKLLEYVDHADMMARDLDSAANGYGQGRSDDRSTRLREARDAAHTLKERIEKALE